MNASGYKGDVDETAPSATSETGTAPGNTETQEFPDAEILDGGNDLETLKKALASADDQIKRQGAEFQNYRRRTDTEKQQMVGFGKSLVLQQLLDVFDDLNRSVIASVDAPVRTEDELTKSFDSLRSGVDLAYKKLMDELGKMDVNVIDVVGQPFNEEYHEAVMQQPAPDGAEPGQILTEVQRGFTLGDRVLRHAKVIVAS
jgi:molecular chaperone GrpE